MFSWGNENITSRAITDDNLIDALVNRRGTDYYTWTQRIQVKVKKQYFLMKVLSFELLERGN